MSSATMIDTHAHLTSISFQSDIHDVLSRAQRSGVHKVLAVSENPEDSTAVLDISRRFPNRVYAAIGLHPEHISTLNDTQLNLQLTSTEHMLSTGQNISAIGEVGLDYTPHVLAMGSNPDSVKKLQMTAFSHFITLGQRFNLPLSIHSRAAGHHALDMLMSSAAEHGPVTACMHAFDGRAIYAERALQRLPEGLYFSIPPCIVRSPQLTKLVQRLPIERLLLESDAPALGPNKNERNEPMQVLKSLEMIAAIKGLEVAEAREKITENALRLFPRLRDHPQIT